MTDRTPGGRLADAIEEFIADGGNGTLDPHGPDARYLRTAVLAYRRDMGQILADRDESLRSPPQPPIPPESGPETTIPALAELIASAVEMQWTVADGIQVGTDVIIEHDSWIRFRRALRRVTNPEETK